MSHGLRSPLTIPKVLAVSILGMTPSCGDDEGTDTSNDSGPATTSATGTATGSGSGTTTGPDSGGTTMVADSTGATTGGSLPNCQETTDVAVCENTMDCVYIAELGGCIIECTIVDDETTCNGQVGCAWYGEDGCDFEPIA